MTEDRLARVSSEEPTVASEASTSKPRRKRKWDQPDESLVSCGVAVSGVLPTSNAGCPGVSLAGVVSTSGALLMNPLKVGYVNIANEIHAPILHQQAAAVVQKLIQPKIKEDLIIAKEIVINDADPAVRYKLTKRQTQEEIQKCTGAVVITRGKYRPPNAVPDGEKPLYLHISAGAHLKETGERILAVDRAAAMVEEMLKQVSQPQSTCVYLGFDADPSLNIVARIRGSNEQQSYYVGVVQVISTTLREKQPLHLFLLSNNKKSLEDARLLAENLLDTVSRECGATRVRSCKVYSAVPPPQQLLTGVQSSGTVMTSNLSTSATSADSAVTSALSPPVFPVVTATVTTAFPYGQAVAQPGAMLPSGHSQTNGFPCSQPFLPGCTSYNGYAGIYPQATPLQQVALALRQSSPVTSAVAPATLTTTTASKSSSETEKRPPQKRKFQESPATLVGVAVSQQGFSMQDPPKCSSLEENYSVLPLSEELDCSKSNGTVRTSLKSILPPPPRNIVLMPPRASKNMPPPPPPPKFTSSLPVTRASKDNISNTSNPITIPDTLVKLLEYGDDDDDDAEENELESFKSNPNRIAAAKPFWAA